MLVVARLQPGDHAIQGAYRQGVHEPSHGVFSQLEARQVALLAQAPDEPGEGGDARKPENAQANQGALVGGSQLLVQRVHRVNGQPATLQRAQACAGQHTAACAAVDQRAAQHGLHFLQQLGRRGLADAKGLGCTSQGAPARNLVQQFQVPQAQSVGARWLARVGVVQGLACGIFKNGMTKFLIHSIQEIHVSAQWLIRQVAEERKETTA